MPAREPTTQVVANLRAQPVEVHHGGAVVVIPPHGSAELPALPPADSQHLAELVRQGLVEVAPTERPAPTRSRRRTPTARASTRGQPTRRAARRQRSNGGN